MKTDIDEQKATLAERRTEEILRSARRIFAQNGYRCTKIEQIADDLSIGKGTLYRYFTDKKSLFLAVYAQGMIELSKTISAKVDPISNPPEKIAAAVRTYFGFFDKNKELIEIMMQVRSEFKEDYRQIYLERYSDYIVKIQTNLQNGIKMGLFREMDVEKTADTISATLQGVLQGFYIREFSEVKSDIESSAESLIERAEAVTSLLLNGLFKK